MSGNVERFERAMNQGHNAAWDQMWEKAVGFYRQALQVKPGDPKALTSLGLALYETQHFDEALATYIKASTVTPEDPMPLEKTAELLEKTGQENHAVNAYLKCAELYLRQRDVNKSIEAWTKVIILRPDHLLARSRLALVYERLGRKPDAIREYLSVASLLQNAGQTLKAVQAASRALQVDPENNQVKRMLAMVKAGKLLPKPAQPRQTTAVSGTPLKPAAKKSELEALDPIQEAQAEALSILAGLLFEQEEQDEPSSRRGMSDIVRGAFGALTGQGDQTRILLHLSQVVDLQTHQKGHRAIEELEHAIGLGLEHPAAVFNLGCLQFQNKDFGGALKTLKPIESHEAYVFPVKLIMGKSRYRLNQYHQAAIELLNALRYADMQIVGSGLAGELSDAYDPLIESQTQQKSVEAEKKLCDIILSLLDRPDWKEHIVDARQQLPEQEAGYPSPLAEMLTSVGSSEIVDALANIHKLIDAHKLHAAMEEALYVLTTAPSYLPLHVTIGDVLLQQGQVNTALEKYATVARCYEVRGESNRSISLYRKIADLSPMDLRARKNLIDLMIKSGKSSAAIGEYLNLAEMYYNLADLENARQSLQVALKLAQESNASRQEKFDILAQLADIEMQSLNLRQAQQIYADMRTLQPDHEQTRSNIIALFFRLGQSKQARSEIADYMNFLVGREQIKQAESFLEKLVDQNPRQPVLLQQQGELLRLAGRREEAIQRLDAAGELFIQADDKASAAEVIRTILALNPQNASQYQQLLAQLRG